MKPAPSAPVITNQMSVPRKRPFCISNIAKP